MSLNIIALIAASVAQFVVGAVWYTFLFGNLWGKMHGFDKLPKSTQEKMMKAMPPIYAVQFVITMIMTGVLAYLMHIVPPTINPYVLAFWLWVGFIVPAQASAALFGGAEEKWVTTKIAVQAGASLLSLEVAALVLQVLS
ncbi:MAG TPA: DUF1761 domain-containing protein [Patescibacteria group bacterium]